MQMQDASIEISAGVSKPARRRRRTRHKLSPVDTAIPVSLEDPNDGDKDEDSDEQDGENLSPPMPIVVLTAPLATVPEVPRSTENDAVVSPPPAASVRAVGFPVAKARRTGLQAKERAMHRVSGVPSGMLARRPSGRHWRAHAPDYDEEVARVHLFKPPLPPTHTDKRRVAVYYTCELVALFKLLKWMEKTAKESRRAEVAEAKKEEGPQVGLGLANWKNTMYLEVLHSSFTPEQPVVEDGDPFVAQRAAALQEKHAFFFATGCCVFWGLTREEEARRLMMLTPFSSGMMDQVDAQDMEFRYGDRSGIAKDAIVLCTMSVAEKIALSFAMAQSATLGAFETRVGDRIRSTKHIPSSLASVGSIQYSQDDTSKLIGQLFIELADVNIHSNILDEPEYFIKSQDNDDFKYLYEKMLKYQDVANRVAILNKRLSILRDLVGVLNQQLTHHHGAKLEWIVIWMLVFQVIIAIGWEIFLKDILGYFHWG
ncbi:hypothetical protein PHYPSEUDO_013563 [Phytophthora pseudosyringae]|uniref:DUF155 domain-containing protein n=1 Tax=Phytophthora pseudosyringae TaxID=221518 RepID=A0A8T1V679_9STRA|nr:hypothetical protein PHYPSEUDO_013563 [Phytophthora pseudosyringae]